ncbi:hypothetical protein [Intrasporangium sp. DVR]|uniref:hypothetical protein n=1 Tax=Intrasporangium sp. DVR TaxID=3127867 RepID=UPI00313A5160
MLVPLTVMLLVAAGVLGLVAAHHLIRRRLVDDPLILVGAAIELGLVVQLVYGLSQSGSIVDGSERATFVAYLFTVLVIVPAAVFIAIKEKTRWAMGVVLGGAVVVAILLARIQQIWSLNA